MVLVLTNRLFCKKNFSPPGGLEPPTFRLTAERASQLRHGGILEIQATLDKVNLYDQLICKTGSPRSGRGSLPLKVKWDLNGSNKKKQKLRRPGIEPGSTAWKAAMLTIIPPTLSLLPQSKYPLTFGMLPEMATRVLCLLVLTLA